MYIRRELPHKYVLSGYVLHKNAQILLSLILRASGRQEQEGGIKYPKGSAWVMMKNKGVVVHGDDDRMG